MDTSPSIYCERSDGIALITLNRPDAANAMNAEMISEGVVLLDELHGDASVRVIIVTGAGDRHFCAGFDLRSGGRAAEALSTVRDPRTRTLTSEIGRARQPVIAAMNGTATGGGLEIALACDMRIMADSARIGLPEIRFGGLPAGGGTQRLPRLVGPAVAKRLIMLGDLLSAEQALTLGVVDETVPAGDVVDHAFALARRIVEMAPYAVEAAKYLVDASTTLDLEAGQLLERATVLNMGSPEERRAAIEHAKETDGKYKQIFTKS
jgi:enoyl-CoA hydratase/carnithine racemase